MNHPCSYFHHLFAAQVTAAPNTSQARALPGAPAPILLQGNCIWANALMLPILPGLLELAICFEAIPLVIVWVPDFARSVVQWRTDAHLTDCPSCLFDGYVDSLGKLMLSFNFASHCCSQDCHGQARTQGLSPDWTTQPEHTPKGKGQAMLQESPFSLSSSYGFDFLSFAGEPTGTAPDLNSQPWGNRRYARPI